jgi:hypothetical protein
MNYSELLKINLIGGMIKEEDIQKMPITDLIILLNIMKDNWSEYDNGFKNSTISRDTSNIIADEARIINRSNKSVVNRQSKAPAMEKVRIFKDTNLKNLKDKLIIKLNNEIINLAKSSQQKNLTNIDDINEKTYIKNIKDALSLI